MSQSEIAIHFFLQLTAILAACRLVGLLVRRIGQPQVVGEMIAGVLLGPSLLGLLWPEWQEKLFPSGPSMTMIYVVSQVGLALYMFLVGLEFDTGLIRHRLPSAVSISLSGIFAPLVLGALTAWLLVQQDGTFFTEGVETWQAMLFLGSAIAITAFPMLARIIFERRLTGTSLGTLALAAGPPTTPSPGACSPSSSPSSRTTCRSPCWPSAAVSPTPSWSSPRAGGY